MFIFGFCDIYVIIQMKKEIKSKHQKELEKYGNLGVFARIWFGVGLFVGLLIGTVIGINKITTFIMAMLLGFLFYGIYYLHNKEKFDKTKKLI